MTYPEAIQYLESLVNYEKIPVYPYKESLKLERSKDFLATIDNPEDNLNCIHIAGTKGKGSTCAFITYILHQAGYRVGLYTSPHLSDFRERIRILEHGQTPLHPVPREFAGMIPETEVTSLTFRLKPAIEKYNQKSKYGPLSFFEVYTALAFMYFKEKKVDFAVLETGLGGRLDATNVVNPLVCAITPISDEHTQYLGNTLKEIAAEKAGIIKIQNPTLRLRSGLMVSAVEPSKSKIQNLTVISAPQEEEVREVIKQRCADVGAHLYEIGRDITYREINGRFTIEGITGRYRDLSIGLLGRHQLINACVATGVIEALQFYGLRVDIDSLSSGLYNTIWPGRCEVISQNPCVVLDGAQNVVSAQALKKAIKENFSLAGKKYQRLILVLGISQDKDIKGICNELQDLADEIILTRANNPRATEPEVLAQYFNGKVVHITDHVKAAKTQAYQLAKRKDLILVCGSLFVVGEFRNVK